MVHVSLALNKRKTMWTLGELRRKALSAAGHGIDLLALCVLGTWAIGQWLGESPPSSKLAMLSLFPAPVALLPGLAWWVLRRRRAPLPQRRLLYVLVAACAWAFLGRDMAWHFRAPAPREGDVRIVHWNLGRPRGDVEGIWAELRDEQAQVYVLAERPSANVTNDLASLGMPDGYGMVLREMSVLSPYPMRTLHRRVNSSGAMLCVRVRAPKGPFILIAVDAHSHPLIQLGAMLDEIETWVAANAESLPVVVIGDFNAPRRANRLAPLRARFRHAYEAAGCGWPYTWPSPWTLFAIDHAWGNEHVEMLRYRIHATRRSDHARQVLDIRAETSIQGNDAGHAPADSVE